MCIAAAPEVFATACAHGYLLFFPPAFGENCVPANTDWDRSILIAQKDSAFGVIGHSTCPPLSIYHITTHTATHTTTHTTTSMKLKGIPQKKQSADKPTKKPKGTNTTNNAAKDRRTRNITDPAKVQSPVMSSVHTGLTRGYRVNKGLPMCFIFDYVSPARLFKRGTVYRRKEPFVQWTVEELANATETDELDGEGRATLMPFDPKPYSCVHRVRRFHLCRLFETPGRDTSSDAP